MSAHTPGPWVAVGHWVEIEDDKTPDICICNPERFGQQERPDSEICANARLIAAAPDLLDVARKFMAWSEAENNHKGTTFWERVDMVRELDAAAAAAIAKAEGA